MQYNINKQKLDSNSLTFQLHKKVRSIYINKRS